MEFKIPELQPNMIVITANDDIIGITPYKKYVITNTYRNMVCVKNDLGIDTYYLNINFIEVDVFYCICLYLTFMRMLNLANFPFQDQ